MSKKHKIGKFDEETAKKIGLHLEPGGLALLEIHTNDEDISSEDLLRALKQGSLSFSVLKFFEFASLLSQANSLLSEYENSKKDVQPPPVHIVLVQAASLECFLNDALIHFAYKTYGKGSKRIAEGLISGSLRSKIYRIIPVLSKGEKMLDLNAPVVVDLFRLIKTRNRIAHTSEYYRDESVNLDKEVQQIPYSHQLTIKQCRQYQKAITEFIDAVWNGASTKPPWKHDLIKNADPDE